MGSSIRLHIEAVGTTSKAPLNERFVRRVWHLPLQNPNKLKEATGGEFTECRASIRYKVYRPSIRLPQNGNYPPENVLNPKP